MTQVNILSEITNGILKDPETLNSTNFITAYNAIYQRCTVISPRYEIKGRDVYDELQDMVNLYTLNLVHYENIQDLYYILNKYEISVTLLKKVYHYLERFFIAVSIDQRDSQVSDLRTLCYTSIYRNYLEKTENKIFELLIFEIDNFKSTKCERMNNVKYIIDSLKNIYNSNDEDHKFKGFIKSYIYSISNKIKKQESLQNSMDILCKKIKLINHIFDPYIVISIRKKLIKALVKRKDELVDLALERFMTDNSIREHFNCIVVLECRDVFENKFSEKINDTVETFIMNHTVKNNSTLNEIINFYNHVHGKIERECNKDTFLVQILEKAHSKILFNEYADAILELHNKEMQRQQITITAHTLSSFFNYMSDSRIEDILLCNFQYRLLKNRYSFDLEKVFIGILNKTKYFTLVNKLNRCLRDFLLNQNYFVCKLERYGEVDLEYRLMTNGFWMFEPQKIVINKTISMLENRIKDKLGNRLNDKLIGFNYVNSAIVVEFNGYEIQMNTLHFLILDVINNEKNVNICKINTLLKHECKEEVDILTLNSLILCENDIYTINKIYDGGDINIFEISLNERECQKSKNNKEALICTKILKILKTEKHISKDRIVNYLGDTHKPDFENVLKSLIENGQVLISDDNICSLNLEQVM